MYDLIYLIDTAMFAVPTVLNFMCSILRNLAGFVCHEKEHSS